jgi:hypothetical protein
MSIGYAVPGDLHERVPGMVHRKYSTISCMLPRKHSDACARIRIYIYCICFMWQYTIWSSLSVGYNTFIHAALALRMLARMYLN